MQIDPPKGSFEGRVVLGAYIIDDGSVVLVSPTSGEPVQDDEGKQYRQKLAGPGDNPKAVAGLLTKKFRRALRGNNAAPNGFGRPIQYPKAWKKV